MPRPRPRRKGKRQRFYARNAVKTTLDRRRPRRSMRSLWAPDASPPLLSRSANSSGADQLCRRMLRHAGASDCLCGGAGAACHRRRPSMGPIAGRRGHRACRQAGLERGDRARTRPLPSAQFDLSEKTETYEIFRHPEGGRKDVFRWARRTGEKPVAELEIYRPGGEFDQSEPADRRPRRPNGPRRARASWKRPASSTASSAAVTLLRLPATGPAKSCLGFIKRLDDPDLQISGWSCQGDGLAGPAGRDRLHAEPADAAHGRK